MTTSEQTPDHPGQEPDIMSTYSQQLAQYNSQALERVRKSLPAAALELKAAGVTRIEVQYDGSGDEGQIQDILYLAADGSAVDLAGKVSLSEDKLLDLFYDLIEVRHRSWENNDGACGEFQWDLEEDTLEHIHRDRYIEYTTTRHEGI